MDRQNFWGKGGVNVVNSLHRKFRGGEKTVWADQELPFLCFFCEKLKNIRQIIRIWFESGCNNIPFFLRISLSTISFSKTVAANFFKNSQEQEGDKPLDNTYVSRILDVKKAWNAFLQNLLGSFFSFLASSSSVQFIADPLFAEFRKWHKTVD